MSISTSTSGATIDDTTMNYATGQSTSTATYSGPFRENVAMNKGVLIWAIASKSGYTSSPLTSTTIGVTSPLSLKGAVTTLAGSTTAGTADGTGGIGGTARFYWPTAITTDGTYLYVADQANNDIRKIDIATGAVTTLAGLAGAGNSGSADGTGSAARFKGPTGITTDGTYLYVADTGNNEIRKVDIATGAVTTLVGSTAASAAGMVGPEGITTDGTYLYVTDNTPTTSSSGTNSYEILKVDIATGAVSVLLGAPGSSTAGTFTAPQGITTDGTNLYVADTNNNRIEQVSLANDAVTTLVSGSTTTLSQPIGITTDGTNLYVATKGLDTITQVVISTGALSTVAGSSATAGSATDGTGAAAGFYWPEGITTDGTSLYVADQQNNEIRMIK